MKRWHEDFKISLREWKKHRRFHIESNKNNSNNRIGKSPYEIDCICDNQIGRYRKKDAYDCGNPKCYVCHGEKLLNKKTIKDTISDLKFKEQKEDV